MKAQETVKEVKKKVIPQEENMVSVVRIFGQDVPGDKNIYTGLTRIKGVSWAVSNALCLHLKMDKRKKISELNKESIALIEKALKTISLPAFLSNRRADPETGESKHLLTNDLDVQKEFDIKKMKNMRSYRGIRHGLGQPVRGQRTRSHFRKKGGSTGIKRKDDKKA